MFRIADNLRGQVNTLCDGRMSGCYRLFVTHEKDELRNSINRLLGTDCEGILYIGASSHLPNRMSQLKTAISARYGVGRYTNYWAHVAGAKFTQPVRSLFPFEHLRVEIFPCNPNTPGQPAAHFVEEATLMRAYILQYGEAPPLNGWRWKREMEAA